MFGAQQVRGKLVDLLLFPIVYMVFFSQSSDEFVKKGAETSILRYFSVPNSLKIHT